MIMSMTAEDRYFVYKKMLELFLKDPNYRTRSGFCEALDRVHIRYRYKCIERNVNLYPELVRHKPENVSCFWWSCCKMEGYNIRVSILKEAIEELKTSNNFE